MTHWTDVPRGLDACQEALDAAADYASFELFWRDCHEPEWLLWAVDRGLVAVPTSFEAAVNAAWDARDAATRAAQDVRAAAVAAAGDVRNAAAAAAWGVCNASVTVTQGCFADCIRAAAEPFTLGPAWFTMWWQQENESPGAMNGKT